MDLYAHTAMQVKVNGKTSAGYIMTVSGVKQGCPISPLLFGLFIEQLHETLSEDCSNIGVCIIEEQILRDILYADDVALLACSPEELQQLLNSLSGFCTSREMSVNTNKTKCVSYSRKHDPQGTPPKQLPVLYASKAIETLESFKYLGLTIHRSRWFADCAGDMTRTAGKALHAMYYRTQRMGVLCTDTKLRIFSTMVMSIADYACQIWGVDKLNCSTHNRIFQNPTQKLVIAFLRTISGCHRKVCQWTLLMCFGLQPVQVKWASLCARIWKQYTDPTAPTLAHTTMMSDLDLFRNGNDLCWSARFLQCMVHLDLTGGKSYNSLRHHTVQHLAALVFDEHAIPESYKARYATMTATGTNPRTAPSRGVSLVKYVCWFHDDSLNHLHVSAPEHYLRASLRFRLGSTPLRVYDHTITNRQDRICLLCKNSSRRIEDEQHVMLECARYRRLRRKHFWAPLFTGEKRQSMKAFMTQPDQFKLCHFITAVLKRQSELSQHRRANPRLDLYDSSDEEGTDDDEIPLL